MEQSCLFEIDIWLFWLSRAVFQQGVFYVIPWESRVNSCHLRFSCSEFYADSKKIWYLMVIFRPLEFMTPLIFIFIFLNTCLASRVTHQNIAKFSTVESHALVAMTRHRLLLVPSCDTMQGPQETSNWQQIQCC